MRGSLHYVGRALDLRIKDIPAWKWKKLARELRNVLGNGWDIVLEAHKLHIHIEWDPEYRSAKRNMETRFNLLHPTNMFRYRPPMKEGE